MMYNQNDNLFIFENVMRFQQKKISTKIASYLLIKIFNNQFCQIEIVCLIIQIILRISNNQITLHSILRNVFEKMNHDNDHREFYMYLMKNILLKMPFFDVKHHIDVFLN